jgi:hypothetical protein
MNSDAQKSPHLIDTIETSGKDKSVTWGKILPTTQGKVLTKRELIIKYRRNNPQMTAFDIANKAHTTPSYVYKVLSSARRLGKEIRGRRGRIFAHGKVFYENWVSRGWLATLDASVVNQRTGMMQVGFAVSDDPCSCQIHRNGHLVIWPRRSGWRDWLVEELSLRGWSRENSRVVVEHAGLNVKVAEGGVKPGNPGLLPKDFYLETEWGVVICRDDSPEKSVLELKLQIPKMQRYLGIPDLMKRLEVIEQGSTTIAQRQRAVEILLYALIKLLHGDSRLSGREVKR